MKSISVKNNLAIDDSWDEFVKETLTESEIEEINQRVASAGELIKSRQEDKSN